MATTARTKAADKRESATVGTEETQPDYIAEAEKVAALVGQGSATSMATYQEYCRLLNRATTKGQVGLPYHVQALYPIIRRINDEIDEMEQENKELEKFYDACEKLAAAFETLQRFRKFIPAECFNPDALAKWLNSYQWSDDPALIEEIGSRVIGQIIEKQWFNVKA